MNVVIGVEAALEQEEIYRSIAMAIWSIFIYAILYGTFSSMEPYKQLSNLETNRNSYHRSVRRKCPRVRVRIFSPVVYPVQYSKVTSR